VYLGAIALITVLVLAGLLTFAAFRGASPLALVAVGLLTALPASTVAVNLATDILCARLDPRIRYE